MIYIHNKQVVEARNNNDVTQLCECYGLGRQVSQSETRPAGAHGSRVFAASMLTVLRLPLR